MVVLEWFGAKGVGNAGCENEPFVYGTVRIRIDRVNTTELPVAFQKNVFLNDKNCQGMK
jgi:hypothetical protein